MNGYDTDYQSKLAQKVSLFHWRDNKAVTCITNYDYIIEESICKRYSQENNGKIIPTPTKPKVTIKE